MTTILNYFIYFIKDLYSSKSFLFQLSVREFKSRYLGSSLGLLWAFIQPTVTVLIFWFVFDVGFKSAPVEDYPFILWLLTGIIPWFFIAEGLSNATNSVVDNSYLVNRIVFRVSMLPVIKLMTALIVHIFFIAVIFVFFTAYDFKITIYALQVIYYSFAAFILLLGFSWLTSSVVVFLMDVNQIIGMIVQFCFWLTPICWPITILPDKYQKLIKFNPVFYIIEGYRDAFIHHIWFWQHPIYTLYFWIVTILIFFVGALVFSRLRPHFADVL